MTRNSRHRLLVLYRIKDIVQKTVPPMRPVARHAFVLFVSGSLASTPPLAGASPDPAYTEARVPAATLSALHAKARAQGSVRVLVELAPDATLRALQQELAPPPLDATTPRRVHKPLPAARVEVRAEAIARLRERLLTRLAARDVRTARAYRHLPLLALEVTPDGLDSLASHALVQSLREDGVRLPQLSSTLPVIGAAQAWSLGADGAGQNVAVLDTGVDAQHPFLLGKVIAEACYSTTFAPHGASALCAPRGGTGAGAGAPCSGLSACDHGTHVAGIAVGDNGSFTGVAPQAGVIAVQVFSRFDNPSFCGASNPCLLAYDSDVIGAMDHIFSLRDTHAIAAANLSLGGGLYASNTECDNSFSGYRQAFNNLRAAGIAPVVAAGNGSGATALAAPGCLSGAIAVGATSDADSVQSWSNSASWLSLLAPGVSVYSAIPGGGYANKSGTSMATPHVAGAFAALRSARPQAGMESLLAALIGQGTPVADGRNGFAHPRIRLDAATDASLDDTPPYLATLDHTAAVTSSGGFQSVSDVQAYGGTALVSTAANSVRRYTPTVGTAGSYRVSIWYPANAGYSDQAAVDIMHAYGSTALIIDQRVNGGRWLDLGEYVFDPDLPAWVEVSNRHGGTVVADGVRFEYLGPVAPPLQVPGQVLAQAIVGQPYSVLLHAAGGVAPYHWQVVGGRLPEGLMLDAGTGELHGLPTLADAQGFTVQVTDASLQSSSQAFDLTTVADQVLFADDFQDATPAPWNTLRNGAVRLAQDADGGWVLRKTTNNDPHGGWAPLSLPAGDFELLLYTRKVNTVGGGGLRYSLTDGSGNGYGVYLSYPGGSLILERRNKWSASELARSAGGLPGGMRLGKWHTLRLLRQGDQLTAQVFPGRVTPGQAAPAHTVLAQDDAFASFTQVNVHGGHEHDTDDVRVTIAPPIQPPSSNGLFEDDFEDGDIAPWTQLKNGAVLLVQDGTDGWVLRKTGNNDPSGGWAPLAMPTSDFDLLLHTRKVNTAGGSALRYSLTDASGNGYGLSLSYPWGTLLVERRDAWKTTELVRATSNIPGGMKLGDWYTLRLTRQNGAFTAQVYVGRVDPDGATAARTVSAEDPAHTVFTQVNINGGHEFDTDNLRVR